MGKCDGKFVRNIIFSHFYLHISKKKCNFAAGNVKSELLIRTGNVQNV